MESKTNNNSIIYLKWNDKKHIETVSNLHMKLLPESVLSKLGYLFLSKFYYIKLTKNNLIDVYLYKQSEEYVGFISCTNKPLYFIEEVIRKEFFLLIWFVWLSIILKPQSLVILIKILFKMKKKS